MNHISFNKKIYKASSFYHFIIIIFIVNIKVVNAYQEINITINGSGTQQIIYTDIDKPDEILINGILQNYVDY